MRGLAFLLLWLAPAVIFFSCGGADESARPVAERKTAPGEVPPAGEVPLQHDFSFTAGARMELPREFPGDVALYPGAAMKLSQRRSPDESVVVFVTADESAVVEAWYREAMREQGWQPTRVAEVDLRRYLRFEKEGRVAAVAIDAGAGETVFSLIHRSGNGYL